MLKLISLGEEEPRSVTMKAQVSAFVMRVGEETVTFVVSTAKETMMTTIYLKGEVQSVKQDGS
jgi:hypothetical protein